MTFDLAHFLSGKVFIFMIVFSRLSGAFMMFPGLGESFVPQRMRALFALMFTFMVVPVLAPHIPPLPTGIPDLAILVAKELVIGLFFGVIMRFIMDIVSIMGSVIAMEIGLSNAMIFNPSLAAQSALPSAFLSFAGLMLFFETGLDHMTFKALMNTYYLFPVGGEFYIGDMTQTIIGLVSKTFNIGIQLAMPFLVVGLILYAILGVMQKMMPQIQLFLVMLPLQILGGLFVFSVVVSTALGVWLKVCDDLIATTFG